MPKNELENTTHSSLYTRIAEVIEEARRKVAQTANLAIVYCNYDIGRMIVEDELQGNHRADYGKKTLQRLSERLTERFGNGFSYPNLRRFRQFYLTYCPTIQKCSTVSSKSDKSHFSPICSTPLSKSCNPSKTVPEFTLSWSHYLHLMSVEDPKARSFYEIEADKGHWNVRWLGRQIHSSLYERLALSRDKDSVIKLAKQGQTLEKPSDVLKNPIVLEFLGMEEKTSYTETTLESAILDKMQNFLLEMGKGFLFEARQHRFTYNEKNFFVDLVLYNRLLQCYVLIDLKIGELSHQDIGQMQMYVHYYDRCVKMDFEKPTIGILLCDKKDDAIVEMTLPDNENIYAAEYRLYLPDTSLLTQKLREWIEEAEASPLEQ
ncbi:MAG: DUF1016 family protein [Victivallales bacterium]|nr:DUF1016 family protein [Victivallales bacterium]